MPKNSKKLSKKNLDKVTETADKVANVVEKVSNEVIDPELKDNLEKDVREVVENTTDKVKDLVDQGAGVSSADDVAKVTEDTIDLVNNVIAETDDIVKNNVDKILEDKDYNEDEHVDPQILRIANVILGNDNFIKSTRDNIKVITADKKFTMGDIPQVVLILLDAQKIVNEVNVSPDDAPEILALVGIKLLKKEGLIPRNLQDETHLLLKGAVNLAIMASPMALEELKKTYCCWP